MFESSILFGLEWKGRSPRNPQKRKEKKDLFLMYPDKRDLFPCEISCCNMIFSVTRRNFLSSIIFLVLAQKCLSQKCLSQKDQEAYFFLRGLFLSQQNSCHRIKFYRNNSLSNEHNSFIRNKALIKDMKFFAHNLNSCYRKQNITND